MENHTHSHADIAKHYRELLLEQIAGFHDDATEEREKYLAALSHFICSRSDAYQYNLTYLIGQHAAFRRFLCAAQKKYQNMEEIMAQIVATPTVQKLMQKRAAELGRVKIVLNDFLEGNFIDKIYLAENFSTWGAERRPTDDVITVICGTQRRSGPATKNADALEKMMAAVLGTLEEGEDEEWES